LERPSAANGFLAQHIACLERNLWRWAGRGLIDEPCSSEELARKVYFAPFVVVSHNARDDPVFTYGNRAALELWELAASQVSAASIFRHHASRLLSEP